MSVESSKKSARESLAGYTHKNIKFIQSHLRLIDDDGEYNTIDFEVNGDKLHIGSKDEVKVTITCNPINE